MANVQSQAISHHDKPSMMNDFTQQYRENMQHARQILAAIEEVIECEAFRGFSDDAISGIGYMARTAQQLMIPPAMPPKSH